MQTSFFDSFWPHVGVPTLLTKVLLPPESCGEAPCALSPRFEGALRLFNVRIRKATAFNFINTVELWLTESNICFCLSENSRLDSKIVRLVILKVGLSKTANFKHVAKNTVRWAAHKMCWNGERCTKCDEIPEINSLTFWLILISWLGIPSTNQDVFTRVLSCVKLIQKNFWCRENV